MDKQTLVDAVIEEMKRDISNNDWMAIDELLYHHVDTERLEAFLPEKQDQEENAPAELSSADRILRTTTELPDFWAKESYNEDLL
jgi:hypothetical protein